MPAMMNITITIDGKRYPYWHQFRLEQSIDHMHLFELQVMDVKEDTQLSCMKVFLGKRLEVNIQSAVNEQQLIFKGIVTAVTTGSKNSNGHAYCLLTGHSNDYALQGVRRTRAFEGKSLETIVRELLHGVTDVIIQLQQNPLCAYHVQYDETDYQLLRRLAALYGEFFFYNGEQLLFGTYTPTRIPLRAEEQLSTFKITGSIVPAMADFSQYDYLTESIRTVTPTQLQKDKVLDHILSLRSSERCNRMSIADPEYMANRQEYLAIAEALRFEGTSNCPAIRPGDIILPEDQAGKKYGGFVVQKILHYCNVDGSYYNEINGVSESLVHKPYTMPVIPVCYPQSAIVVDNNDPEQLGRIKVRFRWQAEGASPWIPVLLPYTGKDKGIFFLPEINEAVWVDFQQLHPEFPIVTGSYYRGKAPANKGDTQNTLKMIRSRAGHTILLDDAAGKEQIIIQDKSGNSLLMDTANNCMQLESPGQLTIKAENIHLQATESVSVQAGMNVALSAAENISHHATTSYMVAARKVLLMADKEYSLQAGDWKVHADNVLLKSLKGSCEIHAAKNLDIQSEEKIRMC
ncbi:uncharacterized protein involved in type VI secretion and phage assembly [Chitinophaga dinghuensis]|uniref:Uncharacterized protein involved in type VI secretion and phage assembly n=1 Tax=Chitinophaga dinghuensis TaxID=1539050 RepID=A0A327VQM2_9BACT|nr:phage baseplate assembly protein V [Chitinophaga dinghuensis]RAJ75687.1 uncharacterized protein involved in type VI secretion and phage assembly [Chitinophaga dinghuensis]